MASDSNPNEQLTVLQLIREEQLHQGGKLDLHGEKLESLKVDVAKLKVKSGLWGSLTGALAAVGVVIADWWSKGGR